MASATLQKTSVIVVILLSIITLGLYPIIWFWRNKEGLNALGLQEKLTDVPLALVTIAGVAGTVLNLFTDIRSDFFDAFYGIGLIVLSFKVKNMLGTRYKGSTQFSGVATFFLTILYLQYKINQLPADPGVSDSPVV